MRTVGLLLVLCLAGCSQGLRPDEVVPIDQVPQVVMKTAREKLPGFTFNAAWRKIENGKDVYEIRGKDREGKTREVEITPAGEFVTIE